MTYQERKSLARSFLGKTVKIMIDRPLGSAHPKHPDIIYQVNYGYIPNVFSGDGEEMDVYLLGVDVPVSEYTCKIIGIAHREDDDEDKFIAAPDGVVFSKNEMEKKIYFQERYFKTTVEALYQKLLGEVSK
ncbi:MAG: inorganic diphosphatase [Clostridia bacterium]|nr:inorganic diphosphatase [Clostridia bacterium]